MEMDRAMILFCALLVTVTARSKDNTNISSLPEPLGTVSNQLDSAISSIVTEAQKEKITLGFTVGDFAEAAQYAAEMVDIRMNNIRLQLQSRINGALEELDGDELHGQCASVASPLMVKSMKISEDHSNCVHSFLTKARYLSDGYTSKLDKILEIGADLNAKGKQCISKMRGNGDDFQDFFESADCLKKIHARATKIVDEAVPGMVRSEAKILGRINILRRGMASRCLAVDQVYSLETEVKEALTKLESCIQSLMSF